MELFCFSPIFDIFQIGIPTATNSPIALNLQYQFRCAHSITLSHWKTALLKGECAMEFLWLRTFVLWKNKCKSDAAALKCVIYSDSLKLIH